MLAYAEACEQTHPSLSQNLRVVVEYHEQRDAKRRRDTSKPIRGTHGSGGDAASDDELLDVLRRRIDEDPGLAKALRAVLREKR